MAPVCQASPKKLNPKLQLPSAKHVHQNVHPYCNMEPKNGKLHFNNIPDSRSILIWLVVWTPLKNISQLGWLFPIYGKIKNVPNHQPVMSRFNAVFPDRRILIASKLASYSPALSCSFTAQSMDRSTPIPQGCFATKTNFVKPYLVLTLISHEQCSDWQMDCHWIRLGVPDSQVGKHNGMPQVPFTSSVSFNVICPTYMNLLRFYWDTLII